jgi:hypothetical protein
MIMQTSGGIPRRREHISMEDPLGILIGSKRCYSGRDLPLY